MSDERFDVLIIGGGIHGVGVAQASAAAGYSTVLLEQTALADGTSSRSSKLIHGGLRYLERAEFGLVRESLRERELLLRLAPTLVRRRKLFLPVYDRTSRSPWMIRSGLTLYALLAGGRQGTRFRSIPNIEWETLDGLCTTGLRKVYQFWDGQADDRQLTRAVMRSATSLGAQLLCPARFAGGTIHDDYCDVRMDQNGSEQTIRADVVVNAAGPWARQVLTGFQPALPDFPVENVQGAHIELPGKIERGCYYVEVEADRRAVFVMPWKDHTLVGTTEHNYTGDPAQVHAREDEVDYLLNVYQRHFPGRSNDVIDSWAGLRVLPTAQGAAFKRSRETQLPVNNQPSPRVLSIFGGKLTGYRATAEKVMAKLRSSLPNRKRKAWTAELPLTADDG